MPDTNTPNLGLIKPAPGELAGKDAWGGKWNTNADTIDAFAGNTSTALGARQVTSEKGQANGYAGLGSDGKVPTTQLPSSDGELRRITKFTTVGANTYTKPSWLKRAKITCVGGGGGGGGAFGAAAPNVNAGAGGAGGSTAISLIEASAIGATETVTVGAGGANGTVTVSGEAGGSTSFGTLVVANGGNGGGSRTAANPVVPAVLVNPPIPSITGSVGDIIIMGQIGDPGVAYTTSNGRGGTGGSSTHGGGGRGMTSDAAGAAPPGGYGGGGSGATGYQAHRNGGDGAPGICIIEEYG